MVMGEREAKKLFRLAPDNLTELACPGSNDVTHAPKKVKMKTIRGTMFSYRAGKCRICECRWVSFINKTY